MKLYPLKFKPIFKERIWGGRRLADLFGKDLPAHTRIGESWELSDLPENQSQIVNGPLAGRTIAEVIKEFGPAITGRRDYQPPFGLLIKLLDAQEVLSVQVHPDADTCRQTGNGNPKTECWYILEAPPDGVIYKGLVPGTTQEQFTRAIEDGTCPRYLQTVPVRAGECHFLPSGTCHAIGAGLVIAEIQQPSDTTYRVFDWNRVDPKTGQGRPLHIAEALECIHFDASRDNLSVTTVGRLVDAEPFKLDKGHQMPGCQTLLSPGVVRALVILTGRGQIRTTGCPNVPFQKGDTLLIPAAFEGFMTFDEETEYLTALV